MKDYTSKQIAANYSRRIEAVGGKITFSETALTFYPIPSKKDNLWLSFFTVIITPLAMLNYSVLMCYIKIICLDL